MGNTCLPCLPGHADAARGAGAGDAKAWESTARSADPWARAAEAPAPHINGAAAYTTPRRGAAEARDVRQRPHDMQSEGWRTPQSHLSDAEEEADEELRSPSASRPSSLPQPLAEGGILGFGGPGQEASTQWVNAVLQAMWPGISDYVHNLLLESIQPALVKSLPDRMKSILHFQGEATHLGTRPLQFSNLRTEKTLRQHTGGRREVYRLVMDLVYGGDACVKLSIGGMVAGISDIKIYGCLCVEIPETTDHPPFFSGLGVYFPNPPVVDMSWSGLAHGLDCSVIKQKIKEVVRHALSGTMVLPNRKAVSIDRSDDRDVFSVIRPRPEGMLRITLVQGKNLPASDVSWTGGKGTSDPYVTMVLGANEFKSASVHKNLNPVWKEQVFEVPIDCPDLQELILEVYDEDKIKSDDFLGRARVSVRDLCAGKNGGWIALSDDEGECAKLGSQLFLLCEWRPLVLNAALAAKIPERSAVTTCMVFVGIYDAKELPPVPLSESHWVVARCGDHEESSDKVQQSDEDVRTDQEKVAGKIWRLHQSGVSKELICDALDAPMQVVEKYINEKSVEEASPKKDNGRGLKRRATLSSGLELVGKGISLTFDKACIFSVKDPRESTITLQVMTSCGADGKHAKEPRKLGNAIEFDVADLLEEDCEENTKISEFSLGLRDQPGARVRAKLQLRVLEPPSQA